MSNREAKHAQRPATKEIFLPFTSYAGGADLSAVGGFGGIRIDANGEYAYCTIYLPEDFKSFVEAKVVFLALATTTPMTMRIVTNWCPAGANYAQANNLQTKSINTFLHNVEEVDISQALTTLGGNTKIAAKDYLGVQFSSQAGPPALNTNVIVLGVRIKYK